MFDEDRTQSSPRSIEIDRSWRARSSAPRTPPRATATSGATSRSFAWTTSVTSTLSAASGPCSGAPESPSILSGDEPSLRARLRDTSVASVVLHFVDSRGPRAESPLSFCFRVDVEEYVRASPDAIVSRSSDVPVEQLLSVRPPPSHRSPRASHARLPPGGNTGLSGVCPHAQPGCPTRGAPSEAAPLHLTTLMHEIRRVWT